MARRRPLRRVPLSVLVIALVVLPTTGMGVLAWREADDRAAASAWARRLHALTEQFIVIGDLRNSIGDEQVFASASVLIDNGQFAVDEREVIDVIGSDLVTMRTALTRRTELAYRKAHDVVLAPSWQGASVIPPELVAKIEERHRAVVAHRQLIDELRADAAEVWAVYGDLSAALWEALDVMGAGLRRASSASFVSSGEMTELTVAIDDLAVMARAIADELSDATSLIYLSNGVSPAPGLASEIPRLLDLTTRSIIIRQIAAAAVETSIPDKFREQWNRVRDDEQVRSFEQLVRDLSEGRSPEMAILVVARYGLVRITLVSDLMSDLTAEVGNEAVRIQAEADRSLRLTFVVLGAIVGLTVLSLVVVVVAISRPLRRLASRAEEVRRGELGGLGPVGSLISEVDAVETVFEDIVVSLRVVGDQAAAILDGHAEMLDSFDETTVVGPLTTPVRRSLRRLAEVTMQLQRSDALSNAIVETAAEAIWTLDVDGTVLRSNAAGHDLVGISAEHGWSWLDLIVDDQRAEVERGLHDGGLESFEARLCCATTGQTVAVLLSSSTVRLGDDHFITVIARDITERKDFEAQLEARAAIDALSGLANRRTAMAAIADALTAVEGTSDGVAVVYIDLDGFKQANDLHGHAFGDLVLRAVTNRLATQTRDGDLLARLGGDEFVVVVRGVGDAAAAVPVAERMLAALEEPITLGDRRVRVGGSFGIAWRGAGGEVSEILRDADAAMFTAKTSGGGRIRVFDEELERAQRERIEIETGLALAMENDELSLVYQPVVSVDGSRVIGAEALVRWHHPERGPLSPAAFIGIAEESDLIVRLGRWGLRRAARQRAAWAGSVPPSFYVSVNIAGVHVSRYDIVGEVCGAIDDAGIDPSQLRIEITETQLVDDMDVAAQALQDLAERGVAVVIDDYGTGFSSISYLRALPLRGIKIDRTLIVRLDTPRERAMVESIVALARLLELEVTAEGVETEEQQILSERIGCDSLQGYRIARPMPAAEVLAWITDRVLTQS